ncbi:hypothetical protein LWI28_000328 [Acer negundo]|uniref:Homer protein n=1 Tax=Acer negundo TaxID=4023 RepID=A0AAD5P2D9_ACENE|nr:hypothetical protein LWI28_000328 [Acer negundo]KAK4858737.1 hypothetical protein QYF36_021201 [Acer negundo]
MVELQSCAGLVNDSALCAIEQEVKAEVSVNVNVIAEISAELQKEREKNAQLMERISLLEAQIQQRDHLHHRHHQSLLTNGQGSCLNATERHIRKFKRQKTDMSQDRTQDGNMIRNEMVPSKTTKHERCIRPVDANLADRLVNWMSMDETQFLHFDKLKDIGESAVDCDDTDETDDEDDDCYEEDHDTNADIKNKEIDEHVRSCNNKLKEQLHDQEGFDPEMLSCSDTFFYYQNEPIVQDCKLPVTQTVNGDLNKHKPKEDIKIGEYKQPEEVLISRKEFCHTGMGSIVTNKKPSKVPFCPKEVTRMLESKAFLLKNSQSHTIRKILVFASLGIRHGCEDMYELDFSHFSILRKGELYVSPKNPGEHVLYENPGVRRKVFYPNRLNPILCPVQILEEEKAMRPSDSSCPSCLFLCIKYGGRTRNLPQNEYVRQRMGRNKLKSFGPVMCRMAMLVHVRSGSFFFKALGITLLFMAGFPDDLVQRETKYRNLDLLQKYYRTDEDAEREDLFLPHLTNFDSLGSPSFQQLTEKTALTKSKVRKQANSTTRPHKLPRSSIQQSTPSCSVPPSQFGQMGYASIQTHAMAAAFQSMPSQTHADTSLVSNQVITNTGTNLSYHNQSPYHIFPSQPANTFMPMIYWPPPNAFPPGPFPTAYGYRSFPSTANYISIHPQPYSYHPSCSPFIPKTVEGSGKNNVASEEADSDSDSTSSSSEPKEALASCK